MKDYFIIFLKIFVTSFAFENDIRKFIFYTMRLCSAIYVIKFTGCGNIIMSINNK